MVQTVNLGKVDLLYYSHALKRRGLFEIVEMTMIEMKDDPRHPQNAANPVPLYCAQWERYVTKPNGEVKLKPSDSKPMTKIIGSGWRRDQADTAALAIRQGGWLLRGYFAGMI